MRLLHVNLRGMLLYAVILILVSIPVSLFSIKAILDEEVDEAISLQLDQFLHHIQGFEYLDDLETDLKVLDQLSSNIHIKPAQGNVGRAYETIVLYDSLEHEERPFRQLSSGVVIKGKPYILTVRMSVVDNDDLVMVIGLVQVALSVLLTAGLILLNRSLSKRLWKPFYKTLDQLRAYRLDKNEPVKVEGSYIAEFDDLNKTVSHLTERNRKVFLAQKEFIENASHELQTPIAVLQSKLDTLMQSPLLSQTDADTIADLEATVQRMARLNKSLLLLSKIDNEQFADTEQIELSTLVKNQIAVLKPFMEGLKVTAEVNRLMLTANRTLIEVLVANLIHNAIRYSPKGEEIVVSVMDKILSVTNKGTPLKMSLDQMTERFSKEGTDTNSIGLGLAIVKKICDSGNYRLAHTYENASHSFSVTF